MKLKINKCPKCGCNSFHHTTTGRGSSTLYFQIEKIISHETGELVTIFEPCGGSFELDKENKKTELRCSQCNYSLARYRIKDEFE